MSPAILPIAPSSEFLGARGEFLDGRFRFNDEATPSGVLAEYVLEVVDLWALDLSQVGFLICCTNTSDYYNPGLGSFLLPKLGIAGIPLLEIKNLGVGYLQALEMGTHLIASGSYDLGLVVCVELLSRYFGTEANIDQEAIAARELFGDGLSCTFIGREEKLARIPHRKFAIKGVRHLVFPESHPALGAEKPSYSSGSECLSREDLAKGLQLPRYDAEKYRQVLNANADLIWETLSSISTDDSAFLSHLLDPSCWEGSKFGGSSLFETRKTLGYVGSAGIGVELFNQADAINREVTLLSDSPGYQLSAANLEVLSNV